VNKDQVKGKFDVLAGGAKRKVGGLTGDTKLQAEGMVQQVKGKVENAWGKAKDVVHEANKEAEVHHQTRLEVAMEIDAKNERQNEV
jgi:uncharacterized protein YjbJ (UPF0337 family)